MFRYGTDAIFYTDFPSCSGIEEMVLTVDSCYNLIKLERNNLFIVQVSF